MLRLDHLAISTTDLAQGTREVEAALGLPLAPGGKHPHMATHNRLLGLGDVYLEVIAPDPDAPAPSWPRWFDLDNARGPARLTNWICACDDLDAAVARAPAGVGRPIDLHRGDLRWRFAVPASGKLPFEECHPALIQWLGTGHPAQRLPDQGARLARLIVTHPDAQGLRAALSALSDPRIVLEEGETPSLRAEILTPKGIRVLA